MKVMAKAMAKARAKFLWSRNGILYRLSIENVPNGSSPETNLGVIVRRRNQEDNHFKGKAKLVYLATR
jgi:hypothetical protein